MYRRNFKRKRSFRRGRRRVTARTMLRRRRSRNLTKKIKRVMYKEVETKTVGQCTTQLFNSNDYNGFQITDIAQSSALSEEWNKRFGQQYMYLGTRFRFDFIAQPSQGGSVIKPILIRVVVIEGTKQNQAFAPGVDDNIFTDTNSEQTTWSLIAGTPATMFYPIDKKKYKTHYDKIHTCGTGRNSANGWGIDTWRFKIWPKVKINCEQTANGDLEQDRQFYCLYWIYDPNLIGAAEGDTDCKVGYSWKTYFKDP